MYQFHNDLSRYSFRQWLGTGRNRTRYFELSDGDEDLRSLHKAAVALAKEHGIDVADTLPERRRTPQGWFGEPTCDELRQVAAEVRRVMETLRRMHVDYMERLGGRFALAGYLLDSPSYHCTILDNDKLICCRWQENYVGYAR